jgi:hypothetical protein
VLNLPDVDLRAIHVRRTFRAKVAQAEVRHIRFVPAALAPENHADSLATVRLAFAINDWKFPSAGRGRLHAMEPRAERAANLGTSSSVQRFPAVADPRIAESGIRAQICINEIPDQAYLRRSSPCVS